MAELAAVRRLLADVCPCDIEEITPEKHLIRDLEIDSFGLMDGVVRLEKEFHISIPDRDFRLFHTVQDILNYLDERSAAKP